MEDSWNVLLDAVDELSDDVRPRFSAWLSEDAMPELFQSGVRLEAVAEDHVDGTGGFFTDESDNGEPLLAIAGDPNMAPDFCT